MRRKEGMKNLENTFFEKEICKRREGESHEENRPKYELVREVSLLDIHPEEARDECDRNEKC